MTDRVDYLDLLKRTLTASVYPESAFRFLSPATGYRPWTILRRIILHYLGTRGYRVLKVQPFDANARAGGMDWPAFGYTMVGLKRLSNVQSCIETALEQGVPGDLCETGVWRGGCAMFMRAVLKAHGCIDRTVWAADSFGGLPKPNALQYPQDIGFDVSQIDYLSIPLEVVQQNFERFGLLDNQVRFIKGWFKDTLPTAPIERLSVLRLDGDLYESTMDGLRALYQKVSSGGFIIVDDYGTWEPCRRAVEDFRDQQRIVDPIQTVDLSGVFWRKS